VVSFLIHLSLYYSVQEAKFANEFSLLTQCANVFNKVELVQALEKLIPQERFEAEFVKTAMKKMKEVATDVFGAGLSELNAVERHPVILMVDKVWLNIKSIYALKAN
jgi:hypothetical protein